MVHPGLAEIPAPDGSQEFVGHTHKMPIVNICLCAGWVLQNVQDGSHLINGMNYINYGEISSTDKKNISRLSSVGSKKTPLCYSKVKHYLHQAIV